MKKFLKLFFVLFLLVAIYSCSKEEPINNENATLNQKKFDLNFRPSDFDLNISFVENYEFGYSNPDKIDQLITAITNELFKKQDKLDEPLLGFDLKVSMNTSSVEPITKSKSNTALRGEYIAAACPSGYESLGVCHSESYAEDTITSFFNNNKEALANGATLSVTLVNTTLGKRVCGSVS
jgi:hypothetical protein